MSTWLFSYTRSPPIYNTAQKMKLSIKDFFSKCNEIAGNCGFGHIY